MRGAFLVLEGLDRAGKSTQATLLVKALKERSISVEHRVFPDRSTKIGEIINDYLTKKIELAPEAVHLLFSANRWEFKDYIQETLEKGTTLVVDRYAASGAAYSGASIDKSLEWCKSPDKGLPAPDLVVYLDVSPDAQEQRINWGDERFERAEIQRKVAQNFYELSNASTWNVFDASRPKDELHRDILNRALTVIQDCKNKPINPLYGS